MNCEDDVGVLVAENDAVARNINQIRSIDGGENSYLSTSQAIMVGLALCRPDLLEQARYPNTEIKAAWSRLDDAQREAILNWWKS